MALMEDLAKVFERAWEDLVYDPCSELPTLMDPAEIDVRWITKLKPLLGFTDDISLPADADTELRRILSFAPAFWAKKPTEEAAVSYAIRMTTGNRFRYANWFDLRMQIDKTVITEELEDFDPNVISFPTQKFSDTGGIAITADLWGMGRGFFNISGIYQFLPDGWESAHQFAWLILEDSTAGNDGIYPIDELIVPLAEGYIKGTFPSNESNMKWTLIGYAGEYITEVRLVDLGVGTLVYRDLIAAFTVGSKLAGVTSGATAIITADDTTTKTLSLRSINGRFLDNENLQDYDGGEATAGSELIGVLNRPLLSILMDLARPFGERIDIVYVNFIDQFLTPGDLDQWSVTGTVVAPSPGGYAKLSEGAELEDADPYSDYWEDQVIAWKFYVDDAAAIAEFRFFVQDDDNYYYVLVDYAAMDVELWKNVSGTPTQIGSSVPLPILKAGVSEVLRVDALEEGSETRIRVKIAGDTRIDEKDTAGEFSAGGTTIVANTKALYLQLVEVNVLPTEIDRVGPNP